MKPYSDHIVEDEDNFFREWGVDHSKDKEHHALDNARLLREVYLKFLEAS